MKKANLLFVFADQWRRDSMGFMEKDEVITPNIDDFSKDSLSFDNAVSVCPLCSPSRASIFTGTYPVTHGVWTNCKPGLKDVELRETDITLMDILNDNNYKTAYIGKWHLDSPEVNFSPEPESGARDWDAYTPLGPRRHKVDFWYSYGTYDNHLHPHYWKDDNKMINIDKWSVEHETDIAIDFINKNKDNPFSLFLSWNPPHTPLDLVPQKYIDMYEGRKFKVKPNVLLNDVTDHTESVIPKLNFTDDEYQDVMRKYFAAVTGIDENFGRLIKNLKDNGIYDDTIIVLTADHGEMLCSHRLWSKHVWYEESIGVPFLIRYGDRFVKGRTDIVLNGVDIMPTILSLMDISIPKSVEGVSLEDSVLNNCENDNYAIICGYPGQIRAIKELEEAGKSNLSYGWRAIRTKRYTYVINRGYNSKYGIERLLYDNINDVYQLNPKKIDDISEDKIAWMLEDKIRQWSKKYKDKFIF